MAQQDDTENLFGEGSERGEVSQAQSWDFARADTRPHVHGLHAYPARMIPQVAARLIKLYGRSGETLLDLFCGSGTSLVEARLAGLYAHGMDINPLALLLAKVKTTPLSPPNFLGT